MSASDRAARCFCGLISALLVCLPAGCPVQAQGGRVESVSVTNHQAYLQFETTAGFTYQPQRTADVRTRWWRDAGDPLLAVAPRTSIPMPAADGLGFFRVLEFTNAVFWYDWAYDYQQPRLADWGLGQAEEAYAHVDRDYDWFIDQADTGPASSNNCGPSSVTMAIHWHDRAFTGTAEEARDWSSSWRGTGWWYTTDIINYLNLHAVPNVTTAFTGSTQLERLLQEGRLVILCMSTAYITRNLVAEQRIGRFYSYDSGHFLVVKGARRVSGRLLFEVYDPNTWHARYADGTPKGRNRHFPAEELAQSIERWWSYLIVLSRPAGPLAASRWLQPVDPATIPAMWGN